MGGPRWTERDTKHHAHDSRAVVMTVLRRAAVAHNGIQWPAAAQWFANIIHIRTNPMVHNGGLSDGQMWATA